MEKEDSIISPEHFLIGNLVDMKLTEPHNITNKFLFVDKSPPKAYSALLERTIQLLDKNEPTVLEDAVLQAREDVGFYSNWKDETVVSKFKEHCEYYIEAFKQCKRENKTLCDAAYLYKAESLVESVLQTPETSFFFDKDLIEKEFNQVEVYWEYMGVAFKSKIDRIVVVNKKIYITDIKTYSYDFLESYYKNMYYLQAAMYSYPFSWKENSLLFPELYSFISLGEGNEELQDYIKKPDYVISPYFYFITVEKEGIYPPMIYRTPFEELIKYASQMTFIRKDKGYPVSLPGWISKGKELQRHLELEHWDTPIEVLTNKSITI